MITAIDHLSSSQINLYLQCGLKYRFLYIDKLPKPFKSSALAFGSAFHSTLDWYHQQKMKGNGITLEKLYKIFEVDWFSQKVETDIRYKEHEQDMQLEILAKEMLGLYFQAPKNEIKGTEIPFTIPLVDPDTKKPLGINLEGFIDLVEADDTIVDFKTSAQSMSVEDVDNHLQLTAYSYAYERLYHKPPKLLKIINFVKGKKPKMAILETKRHPYHYQRFFYLAHEVLKGIRAQSFLPRPSFMCKDCEFANVCPLWSNGNGKSHTGK